ncbi:hypothetical protein [Streptomyces sp. NBC_00063]
MARTESPPSAYTQLDADGSTSCGCRPQCGMYADDTDQAATTTPPT